MVSLFSGLLLVSALGLIVSVALQESKSEGAGVVTGQSSSMWDKSNSDIDAVLGRITFVSSIVFMISALVIAIIG